MTFSLFIYESFIVKRINEWNQFGRSFDGSIDKIFMVLQAMQYFNINKYQSQ